MTNLTPEDAEELYRLSGTALYDDVEITFDEVELPEPRPAVRPEVRLAAFRSRSRLPSLGRLDDPALPGLEMLAMERRVREGVVRSVRIAGHRAR